MLTPHSAESETRKEAAHFSSRLGRVSCAKDRMVANVSKLIEFRHALLADIARRETVVLLGLDTADDRHHLDGCRHCLQAVDIDLARCAASTPLVADTRVEWVRLDRLRYGVPVFSGGRALVRETAF